MKTKLILFITFINIMACASNGNATERKSVKPRYYIPSEELLTIVGVNSALDVISRSRPMWLRGKGVEATVYMNGIQMGGLEALNSISIDIIKDIKFLTSSEATTMYGTNNIGGVIEIRTR